MEKPTLEQVREYCLDRENGINPEEWHDYYESVGWKIGKSKKPMIDWKAAVRTWERKNEKDKKSSIGRSKRFADKLDEIAAKDIRENGYTDKLG